MSGCASQIFTNIDRSVWKQILINLAKEHPNINPNTVPDKGQEGDDKSTIAWNYDEKTNTLVIQLLNGPWYYFCNFVNSTISKAVDDAKNGVEHTAQRVIWGKKDDMLSS